MKAILYYTDNRLDPAIMEQVQKQLLKAGLPIISVSLKPIDFGKNVVITRKPGILSIYNQIVAGLNHCVHSMVDTVFFCEHDVLYHPTHFDFEPVDPEVFYYNVNVWRWKYLQNWFITYDHLVSLSGLCGHRDLLLRHYRKRLDLIASQKLPDGRNPGWARKWGHEPGKPQERGGVDNGKTEEWWSKYPNIDIRHQGCMTPIKMTLDSFRILPTGWREGGIEVIDGWGDVLKAQGSMVWIS